MAPPGACRDEGEVGVITMRRTAFYSILLTLAAGVSAASAPAQAPGLGALALIERGEWELLERGAHTPPRRMCITDAQQLLQPEHPGQQCKRFIVENATQQMTATYDCAGAGQGRTAVRVETARLVQITTQGVSGGSPFSRTIEGRRVGACKSAALAR